MTDDLVQRLRRTYRKEYAATGPMFADNSNRLCPFPILATEVLFNPDGAAAADRIEEMDRHLTMSGKVSKALSERIEVLEAENKRLRERVKRVENNNRELRGSKERVYAATDLRQPTQSDVVRGQNNDQ